MNIGKRIKIIREFRKITQKELGLALGFPETSASIRIAQYEAGTRIPKKETATRIGTVLSCNPINFYSEDELGQAEEVMVTLFWLDELSFFKLFDFEQKNDRSDDWIFKAQYNYCNYTESARPIGISLSYGLINGFMSEWLTRQEELEKEEITREEYFDWKINWPLSCDDGGQFIPDYKWKK